ncbi:MAG: helix-turn-helix domain-containing protein [Syntrophaceae bacterium]|nr:helix-turn-helix domain-containing protein [Syntrophaceae bacterium]
MVSLKGEDRVLTTNEAIKYLRISKPTFLKYIREGRIRAIKAGNGWRILHSELLRFLKGETGTVERANNMKKVGDRFDEKDGA